ncbi:MAG: MCE family protein, partial [candidate division Zixibacteria bacterium]|nr:MCE family protein [Phycisphaerae bacterium]NIR65977.1 MCE family protein [candidate division Zixibacteria bacterium]NIU15711.1 MCE family protein [candidate division Zixibacteria bacterium]NIX00900.1 MCE family protein [Phycisphaerae bacterium]
MRSTRKTEFMVGLFVLLVILILSLITFRVSDISFGEKEGYVVYAYFRNAAGLDEKTKVKMAGVDAGTVEEIKLTDGRARVSVRMYPEVALYSDASALIKSTGLLGDKVLEVSAGSEEPKLKDGDKIRIVYEVADIDELVRNITDVSNSVAKLITELSKPEIQEAMKETILNIRDVSADLKRTVADNKSQVYSIMDKLENLVSQLEITVEENRAPLTNTVANFEEVSASLRALLEKTSPNLESIAKKTDNMLTNVDEIARKVNDGEGTIGKLVNDPKLYNSVSSAADGVGKTINKLDQFRTFITFKGDYYGRHKEGKGYFSVKLQPKPDKYYILGIVSDPVGNVETTKIITDGQTIEKEEVKTKIEFNAQFAKRFNNTALRIGLFESTFGIGADQFFLDDKLSLSVDAWDFGEDEYQAENPHVRVGADYFLLKNLFISAGYDNIFNKKRESYFVGGGVYFEDE